MRSETAAEVAAGGGAAETNSAKDRPLGTVRYLGLKALYRAPTADEEQKRIC
jgi:hypothetical protein